MTIYDAINTVDNRRHNNFEYKDKVEWLNRLDTSIKRNIIDKHDLNPDETEITFTGYTEDTPGDTELLVGAPYDDIYLYFIESQIDYYNGEFDSFNNSSAMYTAAYQRYCNDYNRTHMPKWVKNVYY